MQRHLRQTLLPRRHRLQKLHTTSTRRRHKHQHTRLILSQRTQIRVTTILQVQRRMRNRHTNIQLLAVLVIHRLRQNHLSLRLRLRKSITAANSLQRHSNQRRTKNPSPAAITQTQQSRHNTRAAPQRARMRASRRQQQRNITDQRVTAHRRIRLRTKTITTRSTTRRQCARNHHRIEQHQNQRQTRSNHNRQTHRRQQQNGGQGNLEPGQNQRHRTGRRDLLQTKILNTGHGTLRVLRLSNTANQQSQRNKCRTQNKRHSRDGEHKTPRVSVRKQEAAVAVFRQNKPCDVPPCYTRFYALHMGNCLYELSGKRYAPSFLQGHPPSLRFGHPDVTTGDTAFLISRLLAPGRAMPFLCSCRAP